MKMKKQSKVKRNKKSGVTLISLVITVIVMLILAGITISLTVGEDGIITKAKQAAEQAKIAEIKDRMQLEILNAETNAVIRGEKLEKAQLNDIIAKYGKLQEDGDTIITHEDKYEISLKEIWYGVLSNSGSYTDKLEQIEILEKELADLKEQYKNLEDLNSGNSEVLSNLQNQIATLESEKSAIEEEYREYREIITQAIREAGIETNVDEVATKVAENIKNILNNAYNMGYQDGIQESNKNVNINGYDYINHGINDSSMTGWITMSTITHDGIVLFNSSWQSVNGTNDFIRCRLVDAEGNIIQEFYNTKGTIGNGIYEANVKSGYSIQMYGQNNNRQGYVMVSISGFVIY